MTHTHTHTHSCFPGFSPQQAESLLEGGETKVKGRSRKPGAGGSGPHPSGAIGSRTGSLGSLPTPTFTTAAFQCPCPHPPSLWSLPHLPPFSAATELEHSLSQRAAGSLLGSHSSVQVGGRREEWGRPPTPELGNGIPGFPQRVRQFRVSLRVPRGARGGAVEGA